MRLFLILSLALLSQVVEANELIDLRTNPVLVREGFDPSWISQKPNLPLSNIHSQWLSVESGFGSKHSLSVQELPFHDKEQRSILSLDDSPKKTYSFLFRFHLPLETYNSSESFAILIGSVGINWVAYLNGFTISDHSQLGENHFRKNEMIPVPKSSLKVGENLLFFKIQGPNSNRMVGFYNSKSYLFGDFSKIQKKQSEALTIVLISIYSVIGIFHLLFYIKLREKFHNLYFGIFSMVLSLFIITRTNLISLLWNDFEIIHRIMTISFYILPILALLFFKSFYDEKMNLFEKAFIPFNVSLAIACMFFSLSWIMDSVYFYIIILCIFSLYIFIFIVQKNFIIELKKQNIKLQLTIPSLLKIFECGISSVQGNSYLGSLAFIGFLLFDTFDMIFLNTGNFVIEYGFLIFVVAIAFSLLNRFLNYYLENEELNYELNLKFKEIEYSNQKYKFIIDGTKDLLFTLNKDYMVMSMNQAGKKFFGSKPEMFIGKNFLDLLYTTPNDKDIISQIIQENLKILNKPGKQTRFRSRIKTARMYEPVELLFHLEAVDSGDHLEFIGKGSRSFEESITSKVIIESQTYQIENFIVLADELSQRLVRVLSHKIPDFKVEAIRTGLREILVNSIEHGNLGITFEEKSKYLAQGDYLQLIHSRQKDEIFGKRKVKVEYNLSPNFVTYRVTDEGNGFNYRDVHALNSSKEFVREHGRGIMLAESIFDKVEYNEIGNSVLLTIFFLETKGKMDL
jgi:anti-sigma regulatory factor (Ser/Thr protein kinase)/PAS domain-containing protein